MQFFRAISLLILAPLLTLTVSILGIFYGLVLRKSSRQIQALPRMWGKIICRVSNVAVQVKGGEKLDPSKPYIFAANHQSQFDIFALQGYFGHDFRWLAKKELFTVPVFGKAMQFAGYISVDRTHSRQAVKSLDHAAQRIADGTSVVIFPEGTRSKDGTLQPFKSGAMILAIKSGVPLVPVAISGTHEILPKGKLLAKSGKVMIQVGDPFETKGYGTKQKKELAGRLRQEIVKLMGKDPSNLPA